MTSETIEDKAGRMLTDHCVFVRIAMPNHVVATIRGDHGIHSVDLTHGRWTCSCAATGGCSHLAAVMAVTVPTSDSQSAAHQGRNP
jgi:hypothetical protein